jgi:hypothetical protein
MVDCMEGDKKEKEQLQFDFYKPDCRILITLKNQSYSTQFAILMPINLTD